LRKKGGETAGKTYWDEVVLPEPVMLGSYRRIAGKSISTLAETAVYTTSGTEQQINKVINAFIDLGEELEKEEENGSALAIAP
jgi:hypothetical protein